MLKIGILASSFGSSLDWVLSAANKKNIDVSIEIILSNKKNAPILKKAGRYAIPSMFIDQNAFVSQQQYDQMISMIFQKYRVELVFLVGYNKILSNFFIKDWTNKIFNIHPSLLPEFSGLFDRSIYRAVLKKEVKKTGCTIHRVSALVDCGEILLQKCCRVKPNDSVNSLRKRVKKLEKRALLEFLGRKDIAHKLLFRK